MSTHKQPLTIIERKGLTRHGLAVDTPSQNSDCFRLGMAWQANIEAQEREIDEHARDNE